MNMSMNMTAVRTLILREVTEEDLPIFFEHQRDPQARWMAAFVSKDPDNREAFMTLWRKILATPTVKLRTVLMNGAVVGSVMGYEASGRPEVSYWIDKAHWGKGIATEAVRLFLNATADTDSRPVYARAAKDNAGSRRVLEKCGFAVIEEGRGFANARGEEIEEVVMKRVAGCEGCRYHVGGGTEADRC